MAKRLLIILFLFNNLNLHAQCASGEVEVSIDVSTDSYGNEGYWQLVPYGNNCGTGTIFAGGNPLVGCNGAGNHASPSGGYPNNSTISEGPWCLTQGLPYNIIFVDDYEDGGQTYTVNVSGFPVYTGLTGNGAGSGTRITFVAQPPANYDMSCEKINLNSYVNLGTVPISGSFFNRGAIQVNTLDFHYSIDNGPVENSSLTGLSIDPFTEASLNHSVQWQGTNSGVHTIKMWASLINGNPDSIPSNDTLSKVFTLGPATPNIIDDYIGTAPILTIIGNSSDGISTPRDLDFHPILTRNELWVINKSTENNGGETVKFSNAGEVGQTSLLQQDGNAWHFMSLPTGIAFSENENFATSPGVYDANHDGGTPFTGPTLWSSDPSIYAQPSGGNGSHIDMLHQSPYSMGICSESENIFWVFDANGGDPVRYDFKDDHGPGNDDHSDAHIRRYEGLNLVGESTHHVVSHMVLDKENGMLYIVDTGNDRILKMDIHSGSFSSNLSQYESVAEYSSYAGATWNVFVNSGLTTPSGIDMIDNRLIVSDYATGDIVIYNSSGATGLEIGRIVTGTPGIMGVKIGPDGKIWYVNATTSEVVRIDGLSVGLKNTAAISNIQVYPNPAGKMAILNLHAPLQNKADIFLYDVTGQIISTFEMKEGESTMQISTDKLTPGIYVLKIAEGQEVLNARFVKN